MAFNLLRTTIARSAVRTHLEREMHKKANGEMKYLFDREIKKQDEEIRKSYYKIFKELDDLKVELKESHAITMCSVTVFAVVVVGAAVVIARS